MSRNDVPVVISINEILNLLKRGVTRLNRDKHYNPERGSVQSIYGLTATEVTELFLDPRLANKKTIVPKPSRIVIAEDMEESTNEDIEDNEETNNEEQSATIAQDDLPQSPYGAVVNTDPLVGGTAGELHHTTRSFNVVGDVQERPVYVGGTDAAL